MGESRKTKAQLVEEIAALRAENARARQVLDLADVLYVGLDTRGRIDFVSSAAPRILGWTQDELLGKDWVDLCIPEDRRTYVREVFQTLMSGSLDSVGRVQSGVLTKSGEERAIAWHNALLKDEEGRITGTFSSGLDVTDLLRTENERQRLTQTLVDAMPCVALLLRPKSREIVAMNQAARDAGCKLGQTCYGSWAESDGPCPWCLAPEVWATGEPQQREVESLGTVWDAHWLPVTEDLYLHYAFDITGQLEAAKALEESEERYRLLFESGNDALYVHHLGESGEPGRFVDVNTAACERMGYTREEFLRMTPVDLDDPSAADMRGDAIQRLVTEGKAEFEVRHRRKDGTVIPVEVSARTFDLGGCPMVISIVRDITDRKEAEKALREANLREEDAVRAGKVGLWDWDLVANKVRYSAEWKRQIGYEDHEISGEFEEWRSRVHPDDLEDTLRRVQEGIDLRKQDHATEFRFRHKDGSYRWILAQASVEEDESGNAVRMRGSHVDITDLKQAEGELRETRDKLQSLFDNMSEGFAYHKIITDADGKPVDYVFLELNEAFKTYTGLTDDIIGRRVTEVHPGIEDMEFDWIGRYGRVALTGEPIDFEQYFEPQDHWYLVSAFSPARGYFAVVFHDITEMKRATEALRESEERFRQLFETITSGVVVYEPVDDGQDFRFQDVNPAGEVLCRLSRKDMVGRRLLEVFPSAGDAGLLKGLRAAWQTGEPQYVPTSYYEDSRLAIWTENRIFRLPSGLVVAVFEDVTERVMDERRLRESREQLRALANRLSQIEEAEKRNLSRELHDQVGQILAALSMDLKVMQGQLGPDGSHGIAARLDHALTQVTDVTRRIRSVMSQLRPQVLDDFGLPAALRWFGGEFRESSGIDVHVDVPDEDGRFGEELDIALFRIAQEALTNVLKHAMADNVWVTLKRTRTAVRLEVRDDGIGFDAARERRPGEREGWGLVTMRERALAVGGQVTISSEAGKGVAVIVEVARDTNGDRDPHSG